MLILSLCIYVCLFAFEMIAFIVSNKYYKIYQNIMKSKAFKIGRKRGKEKENETKKEKKEKC